MADFVIRNMKKEHLLTLERLAKAKNLSREEYVRRVLQTHVLEGELKETENKYVQLVQVLGEVVENNGQRMEDVIGMLEEIKEILREKDL